MYSKYIRRSLVILFLVSYQAVAMEKSRMSVKAITRDATTDSMTLVYEDTKDFFEVTRSTVRRNHQEQFQGFGIIKMKEQEQYNLTSYDAQTLFNAILKKISL